MNAPGNLQMIQLQLSIIFFFKINDNIVLLLNKYKVNLCQVQLNTGKI